MSRETIKKGWDMELPERDRVMLPAIVLKEDNPVLCSVRGPERWGSLLYNRASHIEIEIEIEMDAPISEAIMDCIWRCSPSPVLCGAVRFALGCVPPDRNVLP
ncbi:UNVERIFIED_CONTAM: hypothetical protein FKN15_010548 [Acipenser sinensis]